jgi:hypothetical protein
VPGQSGYLALLYVVTGGIAALRLPPPIERDRADNLWKTTCFEAFLRDQAGDGYLEINLSPSNRWAAYAFDGYRSGMTPTDAVDIEHLTQRTGETEFILTASLFLDDLLSTGPRRLGLCAIIEEIDGRKSYWALAHPPGKPDFHHSDAFAAPLPPVKRS